MSGPDDNPQRTQRAPDGTVDPEWTNPARPPDVEWLTGLAVVDADVGIWTAWSEQEPDTPMVWHWCTGYDPPGWRLGGTGKHQVVSHDPMHLEPSLLWPCCGRHGFIRGGRWVSA